MNNMDEEIVVAEKDVPQEQPQKIKQYLLVVDDMHMAFIGKLMPGLRFIEVDGMNLENNKDFLLLVSPVAKPISQEIPEIVPEIVSEVVSEVLPEVEQDQPKE